MRALSTAATGMQAQQRSLDVISNNLANLSTAGFKRQRVEFSDLLYQNQTRAGTTSAADGTIVPTGIQIGLGTKIGGVYRINEQGSFQETRNDLDLAINGQGYFQVLLPDGQTAYTRAGQFSLNEQGEIVTLQGLTVQPGINVPQDAVSVDVNQAGEVVVTFSDQETSTIVGQIELANFINDAGLNAIGNNLMTETEASGPAILDFPSQPGFGFLEQGFIETSNVDPVTEITSLIQTQRSFELNSRVISTVDEMLSAVNNIK